MARKIKKYAPNEERPKGRRADGRLSTKIVVGKDNDGNPVPKYAYGYTKAELAAAVVEIKRTYITGNIVVERDMLFGVYAGQWYHAYIEPRKLGEAAKNDYLNILNTHLLPVFGDRQMRAIMPLDLQIFLNSKANKSKSLINKIYMVLRQIFEMALGQYIIDRNPITTVKKPNAHEGKRRALTEAEKKAVLYIGENNKDGLLLLMLYYTGMRRGEVLGSQWQDVDFKKRELNVSRDIDYHARIIDEDSNKINHIGDLKSEAAYRTIPIPPPLYNALNKSAGIGKTFIFHGPQSGSYLSQTEYKRIWERLMAEVYKYDPSIEHRNVTESGKPSKPARPGKPGPTPKGIAQRSILTPHYFRHNFATLLYDADVDVLTAIEIFGHKDKKLILDVYTDLSEKKKKSSVARIDHIF